MRPTTPRQALVLSGTAVIAVTYGLGRYAYGLFVPRFESALELTSTTIGAVGGLSHLGYALGLLGAPWLCRRLGADRVAAGAGLCAAAGLGAVAASVGPISLGAAVAAAGTASGLASPALAHVVVQRLRPEERSPAQTWINSGTSIGLAVSAPTVLVALHWRATWGGFALLAALVTAAAVATLTRGRSPQDGPSLQPRPDRAALPAAGLVSFAVVVGATSAPYWTFARQQVLSAGLTEGWSVGFWVVMGVCGLIGGSAGRLSDRIGLVTTLRLWSVLWGLSLAILAFPDLAATAALGSAALFGAAYMALTGLLILWAVAEESGDASSGVRTCFLALGVGQAVATPLAGSLADTWTLPAVFGVAATASLSQLVLASTARPRPRSGGRGPADAQDDVADVTGVRR